jgi:hypothetical protein
MEELVKEADAIVAKEMEEVRAKREADAKAALEKEANERGFNSVEAMEKFDAEKAKEEAKPEEAEITESKDDGEEEVTSEP